jgi:hypothetical protein
MIYPQSKFEVSVSITRTEVPCTISIELKNSKGSLGKKSTTVNPDTAKMVSFDVS